MRRSLLDEPRLSEAVEAYRMLGLEVMVVALETSQADDCTTCLEGAPDLYRIIYTREPGAGKGAGVRPPIDDLFD